MLKGTILISPRPQSARGHERAEPFLEFDCVILGEMVLAKNSLRSVRRYTLPNVDQLQKRMKQAEDLNAHQVLKLPKGADKRAVREAYIAQARIYHPDRYAMIELPEELSIFLNAMTRRINSAYAELLAHGETVDLLRDSEPRPPRRPYRLARLR